MSIFDFFFPKKPATAAIAKERLQIVLAHERVSRDSPDFLPRLRRELLAVVARYGSVKKNMIRLTPKKSGGTTVLEINVEIDTGRLKAKAAVA